MANSSRVSQLPPGQKITLLVPAQCMQGYPESIIINGGIPIGHNSPTSGQPYVTYASKASEFVIAQCRGIKDLTKSGLSVGEKVAFCLYDKVSLWSKKWMTHIFLILVVLAYSVMGAMIFIAIEGVHENGKRKDMDKNKNDALAMIRTLSYDLDVINDPELWTIRARNQLNKYEAKLFEAFKDGSFGNTEPLWTFWNAVFYCGTVYTTIGYGHMLPSTVAGRVITIIYAIFGIPIFLILLAAFGKILTRGIKFIWAIVRRIYYTGSCDRVRRTRPVVKVTKEGVHWVCDLATFGRSSQSNTEDIGDKRRLENDDQTILKFETPGVSATSNFSIDDEFNLPISVAISILLGYIFVGAILYRAFEGWSYFESFYFVFISMTTIGFGDFVPKNSIFMIISFIYLVFGLALTSMCINVVQTVLSDSFKKASQKISATIGFQVQNEKGKEGVRAAEGVEVVDVADVQVMVKGEENREEIITPR